jgi:hypothetical protein
VGKKDGTAKLLAGVPGTVFIGKLAALRRASDWIFK